MPYLSVLFLVAFFLYIGVAYLGCGGFVLLILALAAAIRIVSWYDSDD